MRSAAVVLVCGLVAPAWAAKDSGFSWGGRAAVEQAYNDNISQLEGPGQEDDHITGLSAQLGLEQRRRKPLPYSLDLAVLSKIYAQNSKFTYVEFGPVAEVRLLPRTDALFEYHYSPHRLLYEEEGGLGDVIYQEHEARFGIAQKLGARKQLRLELALETGWTDYRKKDDGRDAFTPGVSFEARYRFNLDWPFLRSFTPRFSVEYADRRARNDNYDREVLAVGPGFDLGFPGGIDLRFRYVDNRRDYGVGTPTSNNKRNNNFDRFDRITQYQTWLIAPLPWNGLSVAARYRFRDGEYDEPNRRDSTGVLGKTERFDVNEVGLEITWNFHPGDGVPHVRAPAPESPAMEER